MALRLQTCKKADFWFEDFHFIFCSLFYTERKIVTSSSICHLYCHNRCNHYTFQRNTGSSVQQMKLSNERNFHKVFGWVKNLKVATITFTKEFKIQKMDIISRTIQNKPRTALVSAVRMPQNTYRTELVLLLENFWVFGMKIVGCSFRIFYPKFFCAFFFAEEVFGTLYTTWDAKKFKKLAFAFRRFWLCQRGYRV